MQANSRKLGELKSQDEFIFNQLDFEGHDQAFGVEDKKY